MPEPTMDDKAKEQNCAGTTTRASNLCNALLTKLTCKSAVTTKMSRIGYVIQYRKLCGFYECQTLAIEAADSRI